MTSYQKGHERATTSIHILQTDEEEWVIRLRSSSTETFRDLIEELKAIPYNQRSYDPQAKTWKVYDRAHLDEWLDSAKELGAKVEWVDEDSFRQPIGRMSYRGACHTLHLLPTAPQEVIRASYRALSRIHHPDLPEGGRHDNIS